MPESNQSAFSAKVLLWYLLLFLGVLSVLRHLLRYVWTGAYFTFRYLLNWLDPLGMLLLRLKIAIQTQISLVQRDIKDIPPSMLNMWMEKSSRNSTRMVSSVLLPSYRMCKKEKPSFIGQVQIKNVYILWSLGKKIALLVVYVLLFNINLLIYWLFCMSEITRIWCVWEWFSAYYKCPQMMIYWIKLSLGFYNLNYSALPKLKYKRC